MNMAERRKQNDRSEYKRVKYHTEYKAKRKREVDGFFGCEDCRTCKKYECRHNHTERTA